jgi:hypothetical protein
MKRSLNSFGGLLLVACAAIAVQLPASLGFGQTASSTTAGTSAIATHTAIGLTQLADWNFGFIFTGSTTGSVTINTAGSRNAGGGVVLFNTATADPHAASYKITGDNSAAYSLMFPSSITLTRTGGSQTMTLTNFTKTGTGVLMNGSETVSVGATLHVGALQSGGTYSGTNYVVAVYN